MAKALIAVLMFWLPSAAHANEVVNCLIRPGALCVEANLEAAQLSGADLAMADFSRSNLQRANLRGAHLEGASDDRADGCARPTALAAGSLGSR